MSRSRKASVASQAQGDETTTNRWASLTWEDVDRWAGNRSASRGRNYQRQGRIADLAVTEDGKLLASVMGTERYATTVWFEGKSARSPKIESKCTCPVGFDGCKHAVAVVLAYLDILAEGKEVPAARPDDRRWAKLSAEAAADDDEFGEAPGDEWDDNLDGKTEDELDDGFADEGDEYVERDKRLRRGRSISHASKGLGRQGAGKKPDKRRSRVDWNEKIRAHIREKGREELAEMACTLVNRFPDLRAEFQERIALAEGDVSRLVNQARRQLHTITAEVGWHNYWKGEGHTPDYTQLKRKFERLVDAGHHDEVVKLGEELIRWGIAQIEQSDDEGETATELSSCLPVVVSALARSSRLAPDKILYAIDADLQDEYDVLRDAADAVLNGKWTRADWSIVADRLAARLRKMPSGGDRDEFTRNYKRDRLSNWLLHALVRAGREDELLAVYETEARTTGSYQRLVEHLLHEGRLEDAQRWAREGIEKTQAKWPGIAEALREKLCELARRRKDWGVVAAHAAHDFVEHPSAPGFKELIAAAEKAKCEKQVRLAALKILESGQSPIQPSPERGGQCKIAIAPTWPLPVPDYLGPATESSATARGARGAPHSIPHPHYDVLLEMAIADKRPDDALHWYDKLAHLGRRSAAGVWGGYGHSYYADQVAAAIACSHPARALDIYRRELEANLKEAHISAYENCAAYLRKMRPIMKSVGREDEWTRLLADIRQNYRNRPRFMEILDSLEGRTILQTRTSRRSR
ncbi:MAG: hypothetical protein DCC65_17725 [Planctomycetota bacterium]|nr:MAG: hypothetical protein DCC65_17725 [Planctomycetota bacterium]